MTRTTPEARAEPLLRRCVDAARRFAGWIAPILAAALTAVAFCVGEAVRGVHPFGPRSRSLNDLGTQYVPIYARIRDLLVGHADGDLLFNWSSAFGVPFLGDYATVGAGPASFIVVLFPRSQIDLAVFVMTVCLMAVASGVMASLLMALRPGSPWLAGLLGASYGLCGWAVDDAAYVPMWLSGLVAVPLLVRAGLWAMQGRRFLTTVLMVAALWWANFYTVYMATIAAGLMLLAITAVRWEGLRPALLALVRWSVAVLLGIGTAAILVVPVFRANGLARGSVTRPFHDLGIDAWVARLMPASEGVGRSPSITVATVVFLLALCIGSRHELPIRARLALGGLPILVAISMAVPATHLVWHGFDSPNGSPYRQAFALCAIIVVTAWFAATPTLPRPAVIAGPAGAMIGLAAWTEPKALTSTFTVPLVVMAVVALMVATLLSGRPRSGRVGAGLLVVAVAVEGAVGVTAIGNGREEVLSTTRTWAPGVLSEATATVDDWPAYRTESGNRYNEPLLTGGQSVATYSSLTPDSTSRALLGLGFPAQGYGRSFRGLVDPVTDLLFATGARVAVVDGVVEITREETAPLVTRRNFTKAPRSHPGAFGVRETALGADLYTVPRVRVTGGKTTMISKRAGRRAVHPPVGSGDPVDYTIRTSCPAGSIVQMFSPAMVGEVRLVGSDRGWVTANARAGPGAYTFSEVLTLGTAPGDGVVEVRGRSDVPFWMEDRPIGCLDLGRLDAARTELIDRGAAAVSVTGHRLRAELPAVGGDRAVIATTYIRGWTCTVDDRAVETMPFAGLLSVPTTEDHPHVLACSYRPPGLRLGVAISVASLGIALLVSALGFRRRRAGSG